MNTIQFHYGRNYGHIEYVHMKFEHKDKRLLRSVMLPLSGNKSLNDEIIEAKLLLLNWLRNKLFA